MTLESVGACPAGQHERGQHGQGCENPLHLSLPSRVLRLFIGRLGRRLKGLPRSDTPQRREELPVIRPKSKTPLLSAPNGQAWPNAS